MGNSAYPQDNSKMSNEGYKEVSTPPVHSVSSAPGKFNDAFMGSDKDDDKPTPKSTQPEGSYPIAEGKEEPMAKPTHAPETLIPTETVKGGGK